MKISFYPFAIVIAAISLISCNEKKQKTIKAPVHNDPDPPVWTFNSDEKELGTTDFYTFDIEPDYTALNERLHTDPSKKMYVENSQFEDVISITYKGDRAFVNYDDDATGFSVHTNGAHVTINTSKDVACRLTGRSSNGSLNIIGDHKVRVNLHGVNLKSALGPAICINSKRRSFLVTDSTSVLSDDSLYAEAGKEKYHKGCVCSKGFLAISGKAPLKIIANGADAIHSGKTIFIRRGSNIDIDSRAGSAIKAKNKVTVEGGLLNIQTTGPGGHGIAAKKEVVICGGRTTIISKSVPSKEHKNTRGIKSDSIVAITGGIVRVKDSSVGGKGIRAGQRFYAKNCMIDVLTYGEDDKVSGSKNRGIKGADEIRIDSSRVRVRTENGWNEGLSSRHKIIINNSLVELNTRDDAISAGEPKTADIEINKGRVYADAAMDAIDSNGTVHINGGLVYAIARSRLCRGVDCDIYEFKISPDATLVSLGQITSHPTAKLLEHPACLIPVPPNDSVFCVSTTGKDDNLVHFKVPKFRFLTAPAKALLSLPEFRQNVSYDFCHKASVNPEHTFHGLSLGGTTTNKSVNVTHSFNRNYVMF